MPVKLDSYGKADIFSESFEYKPVDRDKVVKIGNISLSKDEEDLLSVSPDFALFASMMDEIHQNEVFAAGIKHRWESSDDESLVEMDKEEEMRLAKQMELIEAQSRQTFDPTTGKVDMAKHMVTDSCHNTRVFLPKPMAASREAMLAVQISEWERVRVAMKRELADNDKDEQKTNLSKSKKRGLISIVRRIKSGELIIIEPDKMGSSPYCRWKTTWLPAWSMPPRSRKSPRTLSGATRGS